MSNALIKSVKSTDSINSTTSIETRSTISWRRTVSSITPVLSPPSSISLKAWRRPVPEFAAPPEDPSTDYIFPTLGPSKSVRQSSTYIRFYIDLFMAKHSEIIARIAEEEAMKVHVSKWRPRYESPSHRRNGDARLVFEVVEFEDGLKLEEKEVRFRDVFIEDRISYEERQREKIIEVAPDELIVDGKIVVCSQLETQEVTIPDDVAYDTLMASIAKLERRRSTVSETSRKKVKPSRSGIQSGSGHASAIYDGCAIEITDTDSMEEIKDPVIVEHVPGSTWESRRRKLRGCHPWKNSCVVM